MKKGLRYLFYLLGIAVTAILIIAGYVKMFLPNVGPAPDLTVEVTEERIAHGKYLANHVMLCMDCHAVRDFSLFAGPPKPGTLGGGGDVFDHNMGFPGRFISRNLTPTALGDWTDGEIFRAITSGVSKDGTALFPVMPYPHYSKMADEDILSVIVYLRSLEPIENKLDESKADFPVNFIINTMPVKADLNPKPSKENIVEYGRYMITAAACTDCHTRMESGNFVGEPFAGGNEFKLPDGAVVRAVNITPDPSTGIGSWTKDQFVARFKMYADSSYVPQKIQPGQLQTLMPWQMYGGMTEEDLGAIFEYLKTVPAVENSVVRYSPPG